MSDRAIVFVFDLDGVLIQCNGYKRAFVDTLKTIIQQMGLGDLAPVESTTPYLNRAESAANGT